MYSRDTAFIVVDYQNDFADPKGTLYVKGGEALAPTINAELRKAAEAGATIVYTQCWHPETTGHFQKDGGIWPVHCVHDSWGAELFPALERVKNAVVIHKGTGGEDGYSAFSVRDPKSGVVKSTGLAEQLKSRGIKTVRVCGLATDYCVKETALDAVREGFSTDVLANAARPVDLKPGDGERAIEEMRSAGARISA